MPAPASINVTTDPTMLVEPCAAGTRRNAVSLGRQDTDERIVALSFGASQFTAAAAACWIKPGERMVITPDSAHWPLVNQGVYARLATGDPISVNVQVN